MNLAFVGALLGAVISSALLLVISRFRETSRLTIRERIEMNSGILPRHKTVGGPLTAGQSLVAVFAPTLAIVERFGSSDTLDLRIQASGRGTGNADADRSRYRLEQATWLAVGLLVGFSIGVWAIVRGSAPLAIAITTLVGIMVAYLVHDRVVSSAVQSRTERINQQFPDVAEMLAFATTAGEGPQDALVRISRWSQGELAHELDVSVREVRAGASFPESMKSLARRTGSRTIERFTDGLVIAIERGTPLSDVLRAQAKDVRDEHRQQLVETANKRDSLMLIPVVFLILPTVIAIAIFPAMRGLQVLVP